jgi:hypothetical protein
MRKENNDLEIVYVYGGGSASEGSVVDTSSCSDSLASIIRDIVFIIPLQSIEKKHAATDT